MEIQNQLSAKEEELIEGCKKENQEIQKKLFDKCNKIIKAMFKRKKISVDDFTFNCWREEIKENIFIAIRENKIKTNLFGYIKATAINYLNKKIPEIQKEKMQQKIDSIYEIDHSRLIPIGPRKQYKKKTKKIISPKLKKCLDISLEYVTEFYKLKEKIESNYKKHKKIYQTVDILLGTKEKFNYELGGLLPKEIPKYKSISFGDLLNSNKINMQEFKILAHKELDALTTNINNIWMRGADVSSYICLLASPFCNPFKSMQNGSQKPECCGFSPVEFLLNLVKMKVEPPRLIYDIWSKAKDFKRGKMVDNIAIEKAYKYFIEQTWETEKRHLFRSAVKIDSLRKRKIIYRTPSNNKFYKAIINFIYRKSFNEKESPNMKTIH